MRLLLRARQNTGGRVRRGGGVCVALTTQTHTHTLSLSHTHTHTHTYIHSFSHTHTHACTHTNGNTIDALPSENDESTTHRQHITYSMSNRHVTNASGLLSSKYHEPIESPTPHIKKPRDNDESTTCHELNE